MGDSYSKDLAEFTKDEIIEMCPKNILDNHTSRRDDDNRLMGPQIIELEFEKDILDPDIIISGEIIPLRLKREKSTPVKGASSLGTPKKFCRSIRELCRDCTKPLQEGRVHNYGEFLCLKTENKKYLENIQ